MVVFCEKQHEYLLYLSWARDAGFNQTRNSLKTLVNACRAIATNDFDGDERRSSGDERVNKFLQTASCARSSNAKNIPFNTHRSRSVLPLSIA
jgi:hypothetical protein